MCTSLHRHPAPALAVSVEATVTGAWVDPIDSALAVTPVAQLPQIVPRLGADSGFDDVIAVAVSLDLRRRCPPAAGAVHRVAAPCRLGGYPLRPGQAVLFSSYVLHRDPRWHRDPERFAPERWLNGTTDGLPRCAYVPFGAGPRYCPGANLAFVELVLTTATVARRVRLRLPDKVRVRPDARRTLVPRWLTMRVESR